MKKHAIIPIFIPHEGCPNDCVFCNQKKITARAHAEENIDIDAIAKAYLSTLNNPRPEVIEMAMFGGSFTGIPIDRQNKYLSAAKRYKDEGLIDKIHLSTRPDYINEEILDNLMQYGVDVIELGVQSFDNEVLSLSNRGHDSSVVYKSCELIKSYGFTLGIQLMIGLPGDSLEKAIFSAKETVKLSPKIVRLYPTIVIEDTELLNMYKSGEYHALSLQEAVDRTKAMYKIIAKAGINIIRVGLKSSDIINENGEIYGGTFHPAFRQLVEGDIAKEEVEEQIAKLAEAELQQKPGTPEASEASTPSAKPKVRMSVFANSRSIGNAAGLSGINRKYFREKFPQIILSFKRDDSLKDYEYRVVKLD